MRDYPPSAYCIYQHGKEQSVTKTPYYTQKPTAARCRLFYVEVHGMMWCDGENGKDLYIAHEAALKIQDA